MSFVETEASVRYETIDGKRVPVITPKTEVTLTNTETGQEYMSDAEAMQDVQLSLIHISEPTRPY